MEVPAEKQIYTCAIVLEVRGRMPVMRCKDLLDVIKQHAGIDVISTKFEVYGAKSALDGVVGVA